MSKKADINIGYRAALFVYDYAKRYNITVKQAASRIGIDRKLPPQWYRRTVNPGAYALQCLAESGADVHYILTGKEKR